MTNLQVKQLVVELRNKMIDKGYPVKPIRNIKINNSTTCFGSCILLANYNFNKVDITISKMCIVSGYDKVYNTIVHELCHACCPVNENHGRVWKSYAKHASIDFHTSITTTDKLNKSAEKWLAKQYKYAVTCDYCGCTSYYMRKSKFVKQCLEGHTQYICAKCNHDSLTVKVLDNA